MFSNSNSKKNLLSSKRLSNSFDDLRRKSIVKKINKERANSVYLHSHNPNDNYLKNSEYIIVPDKELVNKGSKKCKQYDVYNANIFKKNTKLYQEIIQKIAGSVLELKDTPSPLPIPTNYERLMLYRQRTQPFNVLHQTCAIIYLLHHNYLLVDDLTKINPDEFKVSNKTVIFEAYQAIGLATELSHIKGEDFTKIQLGFSNIKLTDNSTFNLKVNNEGYPVQKRPYVTCREQEQTQRREHRIRTQSENIESTINSYQLKGRSNSIVSIHPRPDRNDCLRNIYPSLDIDNNISASAPSIQEPYKAGPTPINHEIKILKNQQITNELKCNCPEHHGIGDKVEHFNTLVDKNK